MLQLLSHLLIRYFSISFLLVASDTIHQEQPVTPSPHPMSNLTGLMEEESKHRTTWIFLDKSPDEALNEEKLARMANWVSQVTALPPHMKAAVKPANKRQETTADWQKSPEEEIKEPAGSKKPPGCAQYGRYYCSYKEDYPV